MTAGSSDERAESTRRQILQAASRQFAQRAYHDVGLGDILTEAELTKGAMYSHFRSKLALAVAIIEDQTAAGTFAVEDLLSRNLSGLETLIGFSYLLAVRDLRSDAVRAGLNLLQSVGRSSGLQERLLDGWVQALAVMVEKAIADGDVDKRCCPRDVGCLIVSLHMGLRQTSDLDEPERFLRDLERSWVFVLTAILLPHRIDYFRQVVGRRTALAISRRMSDIESD